MLDFCWVIRNIVRVPSFVNEKTCNNLEITFKHFKLFIRQPCDFKNLHFVVIDIWIKFFWDIHQWLDISLLAPVLFTKIQYNGNNWSNWSCIRLQLAFVACTIISNQTERHFLFYCRLVLNAYDSKLHIVPFPLFCNITLLFMQLSILSLILGMYGYALKCWRLDQFLTVK